MSLLHLDCSAHRSDESVSRQLTALFADTWRARPQAAGYRRRDLAAEPVAPLDTGYCTLGRRVERVGHVALSAVSGLVDSPLEQQQWQQTRPLIEELLGARTVLIGAPMYNLSVPAALKAWIDRVSFPGVLRDPDGASLLRETRFVLICTRGGAYGPGMPQEPYDYQTSYLRAYLTRLGVLAENICFVTVELTVAGLVPQLSAYQPQAAESLRAARAQVLSLARE